MTDVDSLRIERARDADIPAMSELLAGLFSIESDFVVDRAKQSRGLALLLAQPDDRAVMMVARSHDGSVVGMASAQLVVSTAEGAASAWIEDVIVSPARRRQGVAGRLLGELLKWAQARGATRAHLLADKANAAAHEFYLQLGWQPTQLGAWRRSLLR